MDFDVIVVGSGPAGVSVAFPLVQKGLRVLLVDGGKQAVEKPLEGNFIAERMQNAEQWKWMIGEDFHALKMRDAVSPKLRVPWQAFTFDDFRQANRIEADDFIAIGSLAKGGLSNAWGCGVAQLTAAELNDFPCSAAAMATSYKRVSERAGISGQSDDDLSEYFGRDQALQPAIELDELHRHLSQNYARRRDKIQKSGFLLGRSRVAALSSGHSGRNGCNLCSNCLWGCARGSLYSSVYDLPALRQHATFNELSGFLVEELTRSAGVPAVFGRVLASGERKSFTARKIILAAGTLASTRLILRALDIQHPVSMLSNPTAAFLLWLPSKLGAKMMQGFGLGQLSFTMSLEGEVTAFGSTFSTTGIPVSEFARHVPMRRRYGIDLLKGIMSSCVVGNLFLPGDLTHAKVKLKGNGALIVSGSHGDNVASLMVESRKKLSQSYRSLGAILLPGSFIVGSPGGDIHYSGTLPMRKKPVVGQTNSLGGVHGMEDVHVVDGSCLPTLLAKSNTLTIMANADRIGGQIAQQLNEARA